MLQTNLERQGINLSVDGNLIYADVSNRRVGINTSNPQYSLDSPGNVRVANLTILANTITSNTGQWESTSIYKILDTTDATANHTGALQVYGGASISANLWVGGNVEIVANTHIGGNLTVSGTQVTIGSTSLTVFDPIIDLHTFANLAPLTGNDGYDIGLKFHYYDTVDSAAFLGRANDSGSLEWYARGTDVANVFVGTAYGNIKTGEMLLVNTTSSTSTTTGALIVLGGVGISGNLNASDITVSNINVTNGNITNINSTTGTITNFTSSNINATGTTTGTWETANVALYNSVSVVSNDATYYPILVNATTGNAALDTASTITFNPDSGNLTVGNVIANIYSSAVTVSGNITADNFVGNIFADTITGIHGNITLVPLNNSELVISSTGAVQLPIGNTGNRPTGVAGYTRYNTDTSQIEYYNGVSWISVTNTVTDQQIVGDGAQTIFTLDQSATGVGILVSINGTLQKPDTGSGGAYTVSGTQLTFAEAPLNDDYIDIRFLGGVSTLNNTLTDDLTVSGNLTVTGNIVNTNLTTGVATNTANLTITGNVVQQGAYYETFSNVTNSGGNLTCNFANSATFYTTLTANVTANIYNVTATAGRVTSVTLIVDQGATPYGVANIQINGGGTQTIKWAGGTGPNTGTASNTDVMSFSLISLNGTAWRVLGQISNYG